MGKGLGRTQNLEYSIGAAGRLNCRVVGKNLLNINVGSSDGRVLYNVFPLGKGRPYYVAFGRDIEMTTFFGAI